MQKRGCGGYAIGAGLESVCPATQNTKGPMRLMGAVNVANV